LEKRFSSSFSLLAAYTWSKQLDYTSYLNAIAYQVEHTLDAEDRPHHFSLASVWQLPVGRGKKYLAQVNRALNEIIGGWEVAGNYALQSGRPISFSANLTWNGQDASLSRSERSLDRWFKTEAFGILPKEQTYALRTTPTTFAHIRSSRVNNMDAAIYKTFRPKEKFRIQFRLESYNALNHPRFGDPNTKPSNAAFGTVTKSQVNMQRILQAALKLNF
jgi:hypothetical protein